MTTGLSVTRQAEFQTLSVIRSRTEADDVSKWTPHGPSSSLDHVRINLRSPYVAMTELFLHGPNIGPRLQQMRGERMAKRMTARRLLYTALPHRRLDRTLQ